MPQTGLFSSSNAEGVAAKLVGSEEKLLTHQPVKSSLNDGVFQNILSIFVTLDVSQFPISWLKDIAPRNIDCIFVTVKVYCVGAGGTGSGVATRLGGKVSSSSVDQLRVSTKVVRASNDRM